MTVQATTVPATGAWERVSGKVTGQHRDRLAVVYVRQSTLRQVARNTESAGLQYGLVERAGDLGWSPSRVLVIDEDTGYSAGGGQDRPGFTRLVSEVGLGMSGWYWASRCRGWPARAGTGTSCWVRHEALCIRVKMEGLHRRVVAAIW
jgi:hypothetical protein